MITGTLEFDYIMSMENLVTKQCFRPLSINPPIIVPRQARDKHREKSFQSTVSAGARPNYRKLLGEKTALFAPFIYKMHYFTKTGSGQT
jgi:hypothetical protein